MTLAFRLATPDDLDAVKHLVESSYRGGAARGGWTHEADLIAGERIARDDLIAIIGATDQRLLVASDAAGAIVGCAAITDRGAGLAYLGLVCVAPARQAGGIGAAILAAAETCAATEFGAARTEMTVISRRPELIAYYQRRGWQPTGEMRPFPNPALDFDMVVLAKDIAAPVAGASMPTIGLDA